MMTTTSGSKHSKHCTSLHAYVVPVGLHEPIPTPLFSKQCDNITNHASAQAIACALRGRLITRFRLIRGRAEYHAKKKHDDVDRTLAHLATDRLPDTSTQIPSLGLSVFCCRCYVLKQHPRFATTGAFTSLPSNKG